MTASDFVSKLPQVKTSIFSEMSALAQQYSAINLSQGFPGFDTPEILKNAITQAIAGGHNQYAPSAGLPVLLEQISATVARHYDSDISGAENITVTSGATEALWVAIQCLVRPGDEVIVFDPAYDSYEPAVELAGGTCQHMALNTEDYSIDWSLVEANINSKTRAIIINTPHNPTGSILTADDMLALQRLVLENGLYLISDEVYEFITFDGQRHESVLRYPDLFSRSFVVSSFGKTFHCTGWKLGYCCAPAELTQEFRKIHQYVTFCSFTPAQIGIASVLKESPSHLETLGNFYQQKRDCLVNALRSSRFKLLPTSGTYFVLLDYSEISELNDRDFCSWLTKEIGVAAIPLSPFYASNGQPEYDGKVIRLCFAKEEATLKAAAEKLCQL